MSQEQIDIMNKENLLFNMWAKIAIFVGAIQLVALAVLHVYLVNGGKEMPTDWYAIPVVIVIAGFIFAWLSRPRK